MKVWTKICGVTRVEDAIAAARLGADAIGINCYAGSPRYCEQSTAAAIVQALAGTDVEVYGVFVREAPQLIAEIVADVGLSGVQLHGGESDADTASLRSLLAPNMSMIRAVAVTSRAEAEKALRTVGATSRNDEAPCNVELGARGHVPWRVLLDSPKGGGSGERIDAALIAGLDLSGVVLAGGLTPENVRSVVLALRPYGVDTASGVERAKGIKDPKKMREFIENANVRAS